MKLSKTYWLFAFTSVIFFILIVGLMARQGVCGFKYGNPFTSAKFAELEARIEILEEAR